GGMGQFYCKLLADVPGVAITALADNNPQQAAVCAGLAPNARVFMDYRQVTDLADVDAVIICTPSGIHKESVLAAAAARKQIFCEKPLAVDLRDADEMVDACHAAGVTLTVGLVRR